MPNMLHNVLAVENRGRSWRLYFGATELMTLDLEPGATALDALQAAQRLNPGRLVSVRCPSASAAAAA